MFASLDGINKRRFETIVAFNAAYDIASNAHDEVKVRCNRDRFELIHSLQGILRRDGAAGANNETQVWLHTSSGCKAQAFAEECHPTGKARMGSHNKEGVQQMREATLQE